MPINRDLKASIKGDITSAGNWFQIRIVVGKKLYLKASTHPAGTRNLQPYLLVFWVFGVRYSNAGIVISPLTILYIITFTALDWFLRTKQLNSKSQQQESRAAARKPRDAARVLFGWSSPTTFLTSIRLAMLRKPRFRATNMLAQNTI